MKSLNNLRITIYEGRIDPFTICELFIVNFQLGLPIAVLPPAYTEATTAAKPVYFFL